MEEQFLKEEEIESYLERYYVTLKDSKGKDYPIEASRMTWQWFLVFTYDPSFPAVGIVDSVLKWQRTDYPNQELSHLFEEYIAHMVQSAGSELCNKMEKEYQNSNPALHPFFKDFDNSQIKER